MANDLIVDLTNYKDKSGSRVDPGEYTVVVEDADLDKSKAGNPMVTLYLRVLGGEFDGATLVDRLTQSEKALFRTVAFMQAIGLPTPRKRLKINLSKFIGQKLLVEVDDGEPYNGRTKSEVRAYMRLTKRNAAEDAADDSDADDLAAFTADDSNDEPSENGSKSKSKQRDDDDDAVEIDEPEEVDLDTLDLG